MQSVQTTSVSLGSQDLSKFREVSHKLEAVFLSELLKSAGVASPLSITGGGIGEEQYSSLLRDEYASSLSISGQLGLAEMIFNYLKSDPSNE